MAMAFINVFDVDVVQHIHDFIPRRPDVEWVKVARWQMIYKTKHIVTYRLDDEGGYVYFYKERQPGWYKWNRTWGREPVYTYIDEGVVAVRWLDDIEYMGVLPFDYDQYDWRDEDMIIMDDDRMQNDDMI